MEWVKARLAPENRSMAMLKEQNMATGLQKGVRLSVSLIALSFLANCSPPPPVDLPAAPPVRDGADNGQSPDASGDRSGLLGGPVAGPDAVTSSKADKLIRTMRPDGVEVITNRPIANPGETAYGRRGVRHHAAAPTPRMAPEHVAHAAAPRVAARPAPVARPVVRPAAPTMVRPAAPKVLVPAPVIKPAQAPQVIAPPVIAAKPFVVPPAVKLAAPKVDAPKVDPAKVAVAAAAAAQGVRMIPALASTDPRLAGLQSDLLPTLTDGAKFVVDPGIAKGQAGPVSLTLPATLFSDIRDKAARHGLDRFAQQTSVTATLTGTGYEVIPASPLTNELSKDKATVFTWQVAPQPVARTPLHVDLAASLTGGSTTLALPLAGLEPKGAAVAGEAADLSGKKQFLLPGLSAGASKSVVAAGLLMVGIAFLAFAARRSNDSQREEERRRRQRDAMMFNAPAPAPEPTPAPAPAPIITPPAPSVAPSGDGRSIVQVIAEAVSDLRDADGKDTPKK
ncbi:MAG: hypothetical protein CFE28_12190 [Alphaproteobacteria bacterium PA2]|nr:MAG: hypothetical protein CFE28_12190 [Alphaproteobacteria bacterium PA2]